MSAPGLYRAPVTKALLLLSGAATLASLLLSGGSDGGLPLFSVASREAVLDGGWWRVPVSLLAADAAAEWLCMAFLLYSFRTFERQMG